ncbi:hypothetical protein JTE90_023086 [Oedothorax gibbosus]|uniref:Uncharacterized protein n=1 Tax=Oedothorax gibbosus TaxID=931172 RepID=A0AAV6UYX0_9ARAC|nr:hypothetical protein JTE90_023086 [Oedothorax gibbosus]
MKKYLLGQEISSHSRAPYLPEELPGDTKGEGGQTYAIPSPLPHSFQEQVLSEARASYSSHLYGLLWDVRVIFNEVFVPSHSGRKRHWLQVDTWNYTEQDTVKLTFQTLCLQIVPTQALQCTLWVKLYLVSYAERYVL